MKQKIVFNGGYHKRDFVFGEVSFTCKDYVFFDEEKKLITIPLEKMSIAGVEFEGCKIKLLWDKNYLPVIWDEIVDLINSWKGWEVCGKT